MVARTLRLSKGRSHHSRASGIGWETTPKFVKVLNFDKVEFEKTGTFLRELLRSCCGVLAKTGAFWQQFRKETRTGLQQNPSVLKKENRLKSHQPVL